MRSCGRVGALLLATLWVLSPGFAAARKATRPPAAAAQVNPIDRVAEAVDGAESSYGTDPGMWRADPDGPQGPMQVSEAAASDVGGGDRFDPAENRAIGRAYLAQLYRRYGDWPEAIAAYNWGIGHLEAWVKAGRPADRLLSGVAVYLGRVLHDSGLCDPAAAEPWSQTAPQSPRCADLGDLAKLAIGGGHYAAAAPSLFRIQLDRALQLALEHAQGGSN
jgi:hypothetical protein